MHEQKREKDRKLFFRRNKRHVGCDSYTVGEIRIASGRYWLASLSQIPKIHTPIPGSSTKLHRIRLSRQQPESKLDYARIKWTLAELWHDFLPNCAKTVKVEFKKDAFFKKDDGKAQWTLLEDLIRSTKWKLLWSEYNWFLIFVKHFGKTLAAYGKNIHFTVNG